MTPRCLRMSRHFPKTLREMREGLSPSQGLLEQAGLIRGAGASGIYSLLPLGWRVHQKICDIVYDEMERESVLNLQLPILQPREIWEQTGRWSRYVASKTMFVTREWHSGTEFGLAPTAEELVTALVASEVRTWRELPLILHQIGPKFRDEVRPRLGLLRGREFVMSDAYSFDRDEEGMRRSFELMRKIYTRIFARVGLVDCLSVQADSGAIGGEGSAEFMVPSGTGEDLLLTCERCDYGANVEKARSIIERPKYEQPAKGLRREPTPGVTTVEQLAALFPEVSPQHMVKTIIFTANPESASYEVAVCIRGDLEVNQVKLQNELRADTVVPADASVIRAVTGAEVGFAGPIGLHGVRQILFDCSVEGMTNFLCGCNTTDVHALDVNLGADFPSPQEFLGLARAKGGDRCAACGEGLLRESRGIEVGHIFMLQRGYSEKLGATFTDESGTKQPLWMGCYGIGTTRLIQAIVDRNRDRDGIIWPEKVAPYSVYVTPVNISNDVQRRMAEGIVEQLVEVGVELMYDDRELTAGAKFKDADLIGIPWRVTVGRKAELGIVELRARRTAEMEEMRAEEVVGRLRELSGRRES